MIKKQIPICKSWICEFEISIIRGGKANLRVPDSSANSNALGTKGIQRTISMKADNTDNNVEICVSQRHFRLRW